MVYNRGLGDLLKTPVTGGDAANWSVLDAAMDFDPGDLVMDENEGDPTGHFCIGNKDAGATLVEETEDEAASWDDHTGDLRVTSGITKVVVPEVYLIRHAHPHFHAHNIATNRNKAAIPTAPPVRPMHTHAARRGSGR